MSELYEVKKLTTISEVSEDGNRIDVIIRQHPDNSEYTEIIQGKHKIVLDVEQVRLVANSLYDFIDTLRVKH